jgi:hypothetical protein
MKKTLPFLLAVAATVFPAAGRAQVKIGFINYAILVAEKGHVALSAISILIMWCCVAQFVLLFRSCV